VPAGKVAIEWHRRMEDGGGIEILWTEKDVPSVHQPDRRGFGSLVIERNLSRSLDAQVSLAFEPDGLTCRIVVPATNLVSGR
jgi:two-component sensor histidine kinase